MFEQLKKYLAIAALVAVAIIIFLSYGKYVAYEAELARLRNQVAEKDQTIESQAGVYTKLARENADLKSSSESVRKELEKLKQDLVAEQQLTVSLKSQVDVYKKCNNRGGVYDPAGKGCSVTPVAPPSGDGGVSPPPTGDSPVCEVLRYDSGWEDMGFVASRCELVTSSPPEFKLSLGPGGKPLKLTVDLSRDKNMQWHTYVTSSDPRFAVDIGLNSVNLEPVQDQWYERIRLHADLGVGLDAGGVMGGLGASYQFGKFELGPSVWGVTAGGGKAYVGLNVSWSPFKRAE